MSDPNRSVQLSDIFAEIRDIGLGGWRYRWRAIGLTWVCCLAGWFYVLGMPNVYEASARMFIDTESSLVPLMKGLAVNTDKLNEAMIQVRALTSRPNMAQIATVAGVVPIDASPGQIEALVRGLQENIKISLDASQILSVTYQHPQKGVVLSIVSQLMDGFIDGLLRVNRTDNDAAQEFLEQKLKEYGKLLAEAEKRLADFKRKNIGLMPGDGQDYFMRLRQEGGLLAAIELKYRQAKERRSGLLGQIEGETPVFGMMGYSGGAVSVETAVDRQVMEYEAELARLRMRFTDSHPDIVRIAAILEDLRSQQNELGANASGSGVAALQENPVYQSMRIQLSAVELELSDLALQKANQERIVNNLSNKVDIIPDVEANFTRLNRDYNVNKTQYNTLLQRLESARLTEAVEKQSTIDFRIIDPPVVATDPVGPARPLLTTVVLIFSIASGLGLALLFSYSRPVFYSIRSLEHRFGIPVLGGIENVYSEAEISAGRIGKMLFTTAVVSIIGIYVLVVVFNQASAKYLTGLMATIGTLT